MGQLSRVSSHTIIYPIQYRWDEYITSDSEEEEDVEEQFSVAFAAEAVAILAIGCVAGLKGLQKVRKGVGYTL